MITKYRTTVYYKDIEPVQIYRETEKTVFFLRKGEIGGERREPKMSDLMCYFDSWDEAHENLLNLATKKLKKAIKLKVEAEDELREIQQMQPPTCSPTSE